MSMRESSQNFLIGITSIIAIGGVIYLLLQFGELDPFFHPSYVLTIQTDNARGLREGSVTEYNGVPIGVVNAVRIDRQRPDLPVVIDVHIDADHEVPIAVKPYAMTALLGGGAILQLEATPTTSGTPVAYHATDGGAVIESPILLKIVEQITAELDARMEPLVAALDSFKELSETYTGVGESINTAIESLSLGDGASIQETIDNLNVVLSDVGEAMKLAQDWLGDEQIRTDVREAVEKANILIEKGTGAMEEFTRLTDQLGGEANTLVKGLLRTADDVALTLEEVRRVTSVATDGEGTVAQLLNNPDLYNSLEDAATRLERTLVEIQLYIEKIKAEGIDVDF